MYMHELNLTIKNKLLKRNIADGKFLIEDDNSEIKIDIEALNNNLRNILDNYQRNLTNLWEYYYELARNYYGKYGDLEVPKDFKTNDGISYSIDSKINLGKWIVSQRQSCLPESEHGKLLSQIGMRFNTLNDYRAIKKIFVKRNIDVEKNKQVLLKTNIYEFYLKILLTKKLGLPLLDKNGTLNTLFYMNSSEFEKKFGITTQELIDKFKLKEKTHIKIF